jgi:hypothetical protein
MLIDPPSGESMPLLDAVFQASLPERACAACHETIGRRKPRIVVRATWRPGPEHICPRCWQTVCEWAARFALAQTELPL